MRDGMTEKRKAEDTICPTTYAALLQKFTVNKSGGVGKFKLAAGIEEIKKLAVCLGKDCQMFSVHFRGCGLRNR